MLRRRLQASYLRKHQAGQLIRFQNPQTTRKNRAKRRRRLRVFPQHLTIFPKPRLHVGFLYDKGRGYIVGQTQNNVTHSSMTSRYWNLVPERFHVLSSTPSWPMSLFPFCIWESRLCMRPSWFRFNYFAFGGSSTVGMYSSSISRTFGFIVEVVASFVTFGFFAFRSIAWPSSAWLVA